MIDKTKRYRTPSGEIVTGAELVEVPRTAEDVVREAYLRWGNGTGKRPVWGVITTALREAGYDLDNPKAQPDPDGWIAHDGGPCPVDEDVRVDIKVGSVSAYGMFAEFLEWNHVTHYRVVDSEDDGWIEHDGGPCPVDREAPVDLIVAGSDRVVRNADVRGWNWSRVTHYRVVGE